MESVQVVSRPIPVAFIHVFVPPCAGSCLYKRVYCRHTPVDVTEIIIRFWIFGLCKYFARGDEQRLFEIGSQLAFCPFLSLPGRISSEGGRAPSKPENSNIPNPQPPNRQTPQPPHKTPKSPDPENLTHPAETPIGSVYWSPIAYVDAKRRSDRR